MPYVYDPSNPLPDFMQRQVYESNNPGESAGTGTTTATATDTGGKSTATKRAELVTASGQGTASKWNTASDAEVEAEYARVSGGGGGGTGVIPSQLSAAQSLADQAAYRAYLNARLALDRDIETHRDENEKHRLALEAARDAWNRTYQTSQLSGYMPESGDWGAGGTPATPGQAIPGTYATKNGNKTVDQMRAELVAAGSPDAATADEATIANLYASTTGGPVSPATTAGTPGTAAAGRGQRVLDAIGQLRSNAQYQAADGATRQQMEAAAVSQATGVPLASAAQAIARLRQLTATTGQMSTAGLVESVLAQTPGGAGTPTLEREAEQNRTTIQALTLLSQLRGPENAFAYANTLANLPESIRGNIQAAMGRLPFTAQNPAQRGLFGDVGVTTPERAALGPVYQQQGLPTATGPRTALSYLPAPQAAQPQQPYTPPSGQAAGNAPVPTGPAGTGYYSDASRGNPQPGMTYAQVITPMHEQMPTYGPRTQPLSPAVAAGMQTPNQWSPTDYNRTSPYARKLQLAGYEFAGEDPEHVQWMYQQSLPRAFGPRTGTYRAA